MGPGEPGQPSSCSHWGCRSQHTLAHSQAQGRVAGRQPSTRAAAQNPQMSLLLSSDASAQASTHPNTPHRERRREPRRNTSQSLLETAVLIHSSRYSKRAFNSFALSSPTHRAAYKTGRRECTHARAGTGCRPRPTQGEGAPTLEDGTGLSLKMHPENSLKNSI